MNTVINAADNTITDEPWTQTSDRNTWRAYRGGFVLTVSRLAVDRWQAVAERGDTSERSPVIATRLAAQAWAERQTGDAR
jgi:hypothetical protein